MFISKNEIFVLPMQGNILDNKNCIFRLSDLDNRDLFKHILIIPGSLVLIAKL